MIMWKTIVAAFRANPKTTTAGLLTVIGVIAAQGASVLNGNGVDLQTLTVAVLSFGTLIGLYHARDAH